MSGSKLGDVLRAVEREIEALRRYPVDHVAASNRLHALVPVRDALRARRGSLDWRSAVRGIQSEWMASAAASKVER